MTKLHNTITELTGVRFRVVSLNKDFLVVNATDLGKLWGANPIIEPTLLVEGYTICGTLHETDGIPNEPKPDDAEP